MITHEITLDLVPGGKPPELRLNQYDSDFLVSFSLNARSRPFVIEEGTTAAIRGTKPDGNGYSAEATVDRESMTVLATGDEQMTAAAGKGIFELTLYHGQKKLNTANFLINVERAALDKDTVSQSTIRELVNVLDNSEEIIAAGQQCSEAVEGMQALTIRAEDAADSAESAKDGAEQAANTAILVTERATNTLNALVESATGEIDRKSAAVLALDALANSNAAQALAAANNAENSAAEAATAARAARREYDDLRLSLEGCVDDAYTENGYLYLTAKGQVVAGPLGPFSGTGGGGGGSASGNAAVLRVSNDSGWLTKTVATGGAATAVITWTSEEDEIPTGNGTATIRVNGAVKAAMNVAQGTVSMNLAQYCQPGSNVVKVTISDVYDNSRTINFSISVISVSLSSTFDANTPFSGVISFPYTPVGEVAKTMHFLLDGVEIGTATTSVSGRQMTYTIPQQPHGPHTLEAYFACEINGETVESNYLHYEMICLDAQSGAPIIASSFDQSTAAQYETLNIPYTVYDPSSMMATVTIRVNGTQVSTQTVDRTEQTFALRCDTPGTLSIVIESGTASKTISVTVEEGNIHVEAETQNLALHLNSVGRSNNEPHPEVWTDSTNNITATLTGFNYKSDGWQLDENGITVLRVSGDARVAIPYLLFGSDFRATGKTIELEFATRDVLDYDAVILSSLSGGRGLSVTAQKATLISEQSEISMQYKENEHIRLTFVTEKRAKNRLLYVYVNGIMSGAVQYPETDDFQQAAPVGISIGSNNCTMDLYCIRVYDNDLTRYQILDNWIADCQLVDDMIMRWSRNNVYDAYGKIVIGQLPGELPYMIIECAELPQYKGDKKTCSVTYVDPVTPSKSFTASGVQIDVQGTSSQYYARKNYKMKYKSGFRLNSGTQASTYALRPGAIPTSTFCMKADVASSEGANNVELARLYNDACPYQTPPQEQNSAIQQGIDGFPCVIFWSDGETSTFLGKYNFNNDKGTAEVFGFAEGDESWEIRNNTSGRVLGKSDNFTGNDWLNDFEARYPDTDPAYTDATQLAALAAWLKSTDQAQATGSALAENYTDVDGTVHTVDNAVYRLAKFKSEAADYLEMDSTIFYYLFTEVFLMVDSRAKNAFPTNFTASGKWCWLPYDFDTALGINNEGALVFSYNLEDIDTTSGGADVFNGQQSVLWINLRQAFYDEIKSMYQTLRSTGALSYARVEQMFEEHQDKWGEAIFNEDAWFKYLAPLVEDGSGAYLAMLQGSKAEQRKWWLYNRFRYMDSKYNAGDSLSDVIQVRGYAKSDVTVTPYADVYASVKYGSYLVQTRAFRNTAYTLACPLDNVNDTEIYIYSASQLADVGDLSGLMVGFADFSMATKIQSIKLGDSSSSYSNGNLQELYLGNNTLLRSLDVRGCRALGTGDQKSVDVSGCVNVEHVWMDGTAITGIDLPDGGILKTLHLPATITNLTIRNQSSITDFSIPSYSAITTLRLENVSAAVDSKAIVNSLASSARVRLIGFAWSETDGTSALALLERLAGMRGLDEVGNNTAHAQLAGAIVVATATATQQAQIAALLSRNGWTDVHMTYETTTSAIFYYNFDGSQLIYTEYVAPGENGVYPGVPQRPSTAQYSYSFAGWASAPNASSATSGIRNNVTEDVICYAAHQATLRTYRVRFYNGETLLQTVNNVPYGSTASFTGSTPEDGSGGIFEGWLPSNENISGDTDCIAQFTPVPHAEVPTATTAAGAYGVEWNYNQSSPALTRVGLAASLADPVPATTLSETGSSPFDSIMPWAGMRRYNIIDGAVAYSEDDAGYSESAYDTVVYIPEFYYTAHKDTTSGKWLWAISPTPLEGYVKHPGSGRYVGRFKTSGSSAAVYSLAGVLPLVNTSRTNFRTYSHNKGAKWYMLDLASWSALQMLYLVEFANFDSQEKLGQGYGSDSQATGATTGALYHTINGGNTYNSYRWIEQPFGRCREWVDGFVASDRAVYTGISNATFGDTTTGLSATGITLPSSNYISGFGYSEECPYAFIPDSASSGSSAVSDYVHSNTGVCALHVGGVYNSSAGYGFFYFHANDTASYSYAGLGSRLLYIP